MRFFILPTTIAIVCIAGIYVTLGLFAAVTTLLLIVLEVTLSFDNAVVNARVLEKMSLVWQKRFLTWGMLIAVFGTRVFLPIIIVAASVWLSPLYIAQLAIFSPLEYAHHLEGAKHAINAFGATFLLMVSLKYFFNGAKEVHWMSVIEKRLSKWGRIEAIEIGISLLILFVVSFLLPSEQGPILSAGIVGIILFEI